MFLKRPQNLRRRAIVLSVEVLIFLALYFGLRAWMQREMVHGTPPPISAADITGKPVDLESYRGRPLLIHFWASWYKICELDRGAISSVAADWPVLTVAMQSGDAERLREFQAHHRMDWRTVADDDAAISKQYGVLAVPTFFILDEQGIIRFRESGFTTSWGLRLRLWLAQLLS